MDRLRREDDGKGRQIKKAQDAEQSLLSKVCLNLQKRIVVSVLFSISKIDSGLKFLASFRFKWCIDVFAGWE